MCVDVYIIGSFSSIAYRSLLYFILHCGYLYFQQATHMITIDGVDYNVPVINLDETCDFLDKYAERTQDGVLHRELIGCYFNQQIQFGTHADPAEYAALWLKLTEPTEFHTVTVPDTDGVNFTFTAYFSKVKRSIRQWTDSKTFWKSMTVDFIAQSPARTP